MDIIWSQIPHRAVHPWDTFNSQALTFKFAISFDVLIFMAALLEEPSFYFAPPIELLVAILIHICKLFGVALLIYLALRAKDWLDGIDWIYIGVPNACNEDKRFLYERDTPPSTPAPQVAPAEIDIPPTPNLPTPFRRVLGKHDISTLQAPQSATSSVRLIDIDVAATPSAHRRSPTASGILGPSPQAGVDETPAWHHFRRFRVNEWRKRVEEIRRTQQE